MVNCPKCGSGDIDLEYDDEGYVNSDNNENGKTKRMRRLLRFIRA